MAIRSMTDVAFDLMKKKRKPITFRRLWDEVSTTMGFSEAVAENKIALFYNNLSLDIRFVVVEDSKWDLRSRRKFEEIHKDLSDIIDDGDEEFDDDFEGESDEAGDEDEETDVLVESDEDDY